MAEAQDVPISGEYIFDGEPFITLNPFNSNNIVIAWMGFDGASLVQMKTRVSFNGGASWEPETAIPHIVTGYTSADPSMAWDGDGNLYLCYIDYDPSGTSGKVLIRKSADGGITWGEPVEVIDAWDDGAEVPVDRPWLVIDRSGGPLDGHQYVTTKPAPWIPFPNRNYLTTSADGLVFGDWRYIDTIGWQIGDFIQAPMAAPAVGADGILHVVYPAWEWTENFLPRFVHASSSDGGLSFSYHEMLESPGTELNSDTSAKVGYQLLANPADPQHLAFLFVYRTLGDNDIYLLESFNGGTGWSAPLRVNADPPGTGVMQDLVWGDFDAEGNLAVCWRDRRNAADTGYAVATEIWGAIKWQDSTTFSADMPVSGVAAGFDDVLYGNGNDFMSMQFDQDTLYAVWGDTRSGTLEIWFNKTAAGEAATGIAIPLTGGQTAGFSLWPNPAQDRVFLSTSEAATVRITDQRGAVVHTRQIPSGAEQTLDLQLLPPGVYYVTLTHGTSVETQMFIKQ